jgi:uncharacterized membrane protein YkvA (DUF1232 family)
MVAKTAEPDYNSLRAISHQCMASSEEKMSESEERSAGFWAGLAKQFRLAWRLLWDPQVPIWAKLVPFIGIAYVISPIDFIPDLIPVLGQLDDIGILLLGLRVFVELVPEEIVLQHLESMGFRSSQWQVVEEEPPAIDAEYKVRDK